MGGRTPEELESLLEDAVVLQDASAAADLFEPDGVLVAGYAAAACGHADVARASPRLWAAGYVADPRRVLHAPGLALAVAARSITVGRRGIDGLWRYTFAVFSSLEEEPMHTVMVRMSADPARRGDLERHLRDDIVPWASAQPGFVSGQWLLSADGRQCGGVIVFDSAEAAERAAEAPRHYARDPARAWNVDSVELFEQVATKD